MSGGTPKGRPRNKRAKIKKSFIAKKAAESAPQSEAMSQILEGVAPALLIPKDSIILPARGWMCRPYQDEAWKYMTENDGKGKIAVLNWHRRAGKDNFLFNLIAYMTTRRKGMYWHVFPELKQGRKAIWEGYTREGVRNLDYIPQELREDVNQQELRINLKTGSTYMIVGAADPDSNLGAGPCGVGYSEFSTMNPKMDDLVSPMLSENDGWAVYISTPRGNNHFKRIYDYAARTPGCFAQTLTVEDTYYFDKDGNRRPVHTAENIQRERDKGRSEEWIRQEYYCDWSSANDGAIYAREVRLMEEQGRICHLPITPGLPVFTAWDLGFRDETVIIFYQIANNGDILIFDYFYDSQRGISHYCNVVNEKNYPRMETHWAPWDVGHKTIASGNSAFDIARQNGINFRRCPRHEVSDGIEASRACLGRVRIDAVKCARLVDALKAYRYEKSDSLGVFGTTPVHDWSSHPCDAFRQLAYTQPRFGAALVPYDLQNYARQEDGEEFQILN